MASLWLGIETTSSVGGVALLRNGLPLAEELFSVMATHSEELLPGIEKLMLRCGVTGGDVCGIAVSAGPGSYTGLRIGISTAQGLARGWGSGVVAVPTLRALACSTGSSLPVLSCIRARKGEVYAAVYEKGSPGSDEILKPGIYTERAVLEGISGMRELTAAGSGQRTIRLPGNVRRTDGSMDVPSPTEVAMLGAFMASEKGFDSYPSPIYLRDFNQKASDRVP